MSTRLTDRTMIGILERLQVDESRGLDHSAGAWPNCISDRHTLLSHCTALEAELQEAREELADVKGPQFEKRCEQVKANFDAKLINYRAKLTAAVRELIPELSQRGMDDNFGRAGVAAANDIIKLIESTEP